MRPDDAHDSSLKEQVIKLFEESPHEEAKEISRIFSKLCNNEPEILIEIIGIDKVLGHNSYYMEEMIQTLREITMPMKYVDQEFPRRVTADAKKRFFISYYMKTNRFPNWTTEDETKIPFVGDLRNNILTRDIRLSDIDPWLNIQIMRTLPYDCSNDLTDIKDSAISQVLSRIKSTYDPCARFIRHGERDKGPSLDSDDRKCLFKYLKTDDSVLHELIWQRLNGYRDPDDMVIRGNAKENQASARVFFAQTFNQRAVQTNREKNIAKFLFRFDNDQTMTMKEQQLRNIQARIINQMGPGCYILVLDLKKWNQTFRHQCTYWFGLLLDDIFGMPGLFSQSHVDFCTTTFVASDRLCPPKFKDGIPVEGPYCHKYQQGGCDGFNQKFWTFITSAVIHYTNIEHKITIKVLGQGDNQIIMFYNNDNIPDQEMENKVAAFKKSLEENFAKLNLILKGEETFWSKKLFTYGKVSSYDNKPVSSALKRSVMNPDLNDGLNSIITAIENIRTTAESICKVDFTPFPAFLIYSFEMSHYLQRKGIANHPDTAFCIINWPSVFGGMPVGNLIHMQISGIDDDVTCWLDILKDMSILLPGDFIRLMMCCTVEQSSRMNYERLLTQPFSLNIPTLPSTSGKIREMVRSYVAEMTDLNPSVERILNASTDEIKEQLISTLMTMRPLFYYYIAFR